ncbi:MAG: sigma 54-interacting transcriptional regulator [Acidobacteriota bacterium]
MAEADTTRKMMDVVIDVADSEVDTFLIQGESGTGKNVLARHIHSISRRRQKPILELSCAAVPDTLIESELFGHERGAFTDAKTTRRGVFELADGGTVVLDEIGELKLELQSKLLHVLEERRLRRVGGTREIRIDVRVIGLTNRDLAAMTQSGTFRQDLFYRLNIFPITVPPLRQRPEDILPLAYHFLETLKSKLGRDFRGFSQEAEDALLSYSWPGNIRELRNVVERAMILDRSDKIEASSLILDQVGTDVDQRTQQPSDVPIMTLEEMERRMIRKAMNATRNNQTRAARLLGLTRDQLRYRLKKLDLDPNT